MKRTLSFVFLLSTLLLAFTPGAQADNTTCSGAIFIIPDGSAHEGTFTAVDQDRWFRFFAKANRSYTVISENLEPTDEQSSVQGSGLFSTCTSGMVGGTLTSTSLDATEPVSFIAPGGPTLGSLKIGFKAASDTHVFFRARSPGSGTVGSFRVRVEETTLFSPLWSTFGGFETFYRFQNSTNSSCNVTLRMVNDAGTQVANSSFPIPANSTVPTVFTGPMAQGGLNLANDQAGQAVITHDCPPGAIQVDGFTGRFDLAAPVVLPIKVLTARQMR